MDLNQRLFYVTFSIRSYSYIRGTASEPAYSENDLKLRLVGVLQNLTLSEKMFVRTGFEHLYSGFSDLCNTGVNHKAEIKIRTFLASYGQTNRSFLDQFVLFIQSCKLPTNWISHFRPWECALQRSLKPLYMPLWPIEAKMYSWTDTFSDPRLQKSKHSNNSDRSSEQQDMQVLG